MCLFSFFFGLGGGRESLPFDFLLSTPFSKSILDSGDKLLGRY